MPIALHATSPGSIGLPGSECRRHGTAAKAGFIFQPDCAGFFVQHLAPLRRHGYGHSGFRVSTRAAIRQETSDGHEYQLGVNYLGHFLLANLLLDHMASSASHGNLAILSRAVAWLGLAASGCYSCASLGCAAC